MDLHSGSCLATLMLISRNTNFSIYMYAHTYTWHVLSPNSKLILCRGRKLSNTKPINRWCVAFLAQETAWKSALGTCEFAASSLYFTETLILQSKFNILCLLSLWELPSWWEQRHFLNFSRHQEINLYRGETAQYALMCRGKHLIAQHEKYQELVQWQYTNHNGPKQSGIWQDRKPRWTYPTARRPPSQDLGAPCLEHLARRWLGSISHRWISNKTFPALNNTLVSCSSVASFPGTFVLIVNLKVQDEACASVAHWQSSLEWEQMGPPSSRGTWMWETFCCSSSHCWR